MSIPSVNFMGFQPEEHKRAMNTLNRVIELKNKNRIAAEEYAGDEIQEQELAARRLEPVLDAISNASQDVLTYKSDRDVKTASQEVLDSIQVLRETQRALKSDPYNEGLKTMVSSYTAQSSYAIAKMEYLIAAEQLSKADDAGSLNAFNTLLVSRDRYVDALAAFQKADILPGFIHTVKVMQAPAEGSVFPGANIPVSPDVRLVGVSALPVPYSGPSPPKKSPKPKASDKPLPKIPPAVKTPPRPSAPAPDPPIFTPPLTESEPEEPKLKKFPLEKKEAPQKADPMDKPPPKHKISEAIINMPDDLSKVPKWLRTQNYKSDPGTIALIDSRDNQTGSRKGLVINDAVNRGFEVGELTLINGAYTLRFGKKVEIRNKDDINDFLFHMATLPVPSGDEIGTAGIANIIGMHARVFGGWGTEFWKTNAVSNPFTDLIIKHPKYRGIILQISKGTSREKREKTVLEPYRKNVGLGVKVHTKPLPKASSMKMTASGVYGGLVFDVPALYNDGKLIARKADSAGGPPIISEPMQPGLKNLLIKRAMATTINKAPPETQKQLKRVRKLAGFLPSKKTGAADGQGVIVVGGPEDIVKRLKVACGVWEAGNRSKENANLISELASKLHELGIIDVDRYKAILKRFKA